MHHRRSQLLWFLIANFVLLSFIFYYLNHHFFHFSTHDYSFETYHGLICIFLALLTAGCRLWFGTTHGLSERLYDLLGVLSLYYLFFWAAIALQYTPFPTIDAYLVRFDALLYIDVGQSVTWLYQHHELKRFFELMYEVMDVVVPFCLLSLIVLRRRDLLNQYYFLMITCTLFGYLIYYFFPTKAPASLLISPHFQSSQYATGLKFDQIHQYLKPTTDEGGLISFPSFHVIWTWFSIYAMRCWAWIFVVLSIYWFCLSIACVLLGWHYVSDVVGSILLIGLTHWIDRSITSAINK